MSSITVIMLNWKREANVINNINHYMSYGLVKEIIVFNNNPASNLKNIGNNKVTIIESSRNLGLYPRYAAAGLARSSCVLHCDDDLFIPEETVNGLYHHWLNNQEICHGLEGRRIGREYNTANVIGDAHVILTRCLMVSKFNCLSAYGFTPWFEDLPGEPRGNGEDIILSYVSMYNSGRLNRTHACTYHNYRNYIRNSDGSSDSIHQTYPDHLRHRTEVVRRCKTMFNL
jgi:hypothetical protein